jgi:hypothetical protein
VDIFAAFARTHWAYHLYLAGIEIVHYAHNRRRGFAALACLVAVLFLYAPLAGAAWSSHAMACCANGYCNIPQHHHPKAPAHSAVPEDCGHARGMMDCSMSCCQDPDKTVVSSVAFLLPAATFAAPGAAVTGAAGRVQSIEIARTIEPLSPPPRTNDTAL